jgi:hypothetical protein
MKKEFKKSLKNTLPPSLSFFLSLPLSPPPTFLDAKRGEADRREADESQHSGHMLPHRHRQRVRREGAESKHRRERGGGGMLEEREGGVEGSLEVQQGHLDGEELACGVDGDGVGTV